MPLPFSKNQARRLGERLRAGDYSADDLVQLQSLLEEYDRALAVAVKTVSDGASTKASSRVKNTGTIIEKLRRSSAAQLHSIQDLAGMRIVMNGSDRRAQDELADRLSSLFEDATHPVKRVDRRTDPRSGYRAVHLIVHVDDLPVEIQIRTELQHEWAEFFEKLADRLGRGIRYGEPVNVANLNLPDTMNVPSLQKLVDDVVNLAQIIADLFAAMEEEDAEGLEGGEERERHLRRGRETMRVLIELSNLLTALSDMVR